MTEQLPALVVLVPLLVALVLPFAGRGDRPWFLATLGSWGVFGLTVALARRVFAGGEVVRYAIGAWRIPWGIEFRVDALNALILLVIAIVAAVATPYARLSIGHDLPEDKRGFFYALWMIFISGLLGVTMSGDMFNVYVLVEVSSLSGYALVAMGRYHHRRALGASIQYLILGTIGASFFLIGVGYLYGVTGTLNMADLADRVRLLPGNRAVITASGFILVGLGVKMALFPLHGWLPDAHGNAPPIVSAFLSGVAIKVAAYVMIRFLFTVMGVDFSFSKFPAGPVLLTLSSLAVIFGSLAAIRQNALKRLLAYSSVAQIGYIAMGVGLATTAGLSGGLIHVFNHALIKSGLFLVSGVILYCAGEADMSDLRGLGRKLPFTMAAFVAGGLGLIGVPLTAGFVSKWYLVSAALDRGLFPLAAVLLLGSVLAVAYVWKVVEPAYFQSAPENRTVKPEPWSLVVPAWVLIGASVYFGVDASLSSSMVHQAAELLLGF